MQTSTRLWRLREQRSYILQFNVASLEFQRNARDERYILLHHLIILDLATTNNKLYSEQFDFLSHLLSKLLKPSLRYNCMPEIVRFQSNNGQSVRG